MPFRLLLINALVLFVFMTLWFWLAYSRRRIDSVDIAWGLGFVVTAWPVALQEPSRRSLLVVVLVSFWGLRLANHIYQRSKTKGEDPRYTELSRKWRGNVWRRAYISVYLVQAGLIWLVGLPIVLVSGRQLDGLGWLGVLGAAIWLIGFIIEAAADRQLAAFLRQSDHPKVLQTGLWRYSRHPNYFGELTQWWGIGVIALQVSYGWVGLIGPAVLSVLIVFISGIPPIEKRRVKDPAYRKYQQHTSPLIPLPPRQ